VGDRRGEMAQTMYAHMHNCINKQINKNFKKNKVIQKI
jgi:hypothetical protein